MDFDRVPARIILHNAGPVEGARIYVRLDADGIPHRGDVTHAVWLLDPHVRRPYLMTAYAVDNEFQVVDKDREDVIGTLYLGEKAAP